jgi:hypothetical protein
MAIDLRIDTTMDVTIKEAEDMTGIAMCSAGNRGGFTGLMATGSGFMFRRGSSYHRGLSLHRLLRRASASFFLPSLFVHKGIVLRRQLIRTIFILS